MATGKPHLGNLLIEEPASQVTLGHFKWRIRTDQNTRWSQLPQEGEAALATPSGTESVRAHAHTTALR